MTIHVPAWDLQARIAELLQAAHAGEDVVIEQAGVPTARLVPVAPPMDDAERQRRAERRRSAFGMYRHLVQNPDDVVVPPSMTDEEYEERLERKFGPAA